ncbi:MAG: hypothetical protein IH983_10290 [Planctomycetes bacterium]|nr:hypothetical protein [Planctomycetota bacterium]
MPTTPRSIDLLQEVTDLLSHLRAPRNRPTSESVAIVRLVVALDQNGEGRFVICERPDELERQAPRPDCILRNNTTGATLTVEATQLFAHPNQYQRLMFEINVITRLCPLLNGNIEGGYLLVLPQYGAISRSNLNAACGKIASAMIAKGPSLTVTQSSSLPFNSLLIKMSDEGDDLSWCTSVDDPHWRCSPKAFITNDESCREQVEPIFTEAISKFAGFCEGESVLVVHTHLPPTVDFAAVASAMREEFERIDRLYEVPAKSDIARRVW